MHVRVQAAAVTRFGRRPETLIEILAEAGTQALEGIGRKTVDGLLVGTMAAGSFARVENITGQLAHQLGLENTAGYRIEAASASGAAAFHAGVAAVSSGSFRRLLVVAGERMSGLPTAEVSGILARTLAPSEQAAGATLPALAALVAQAYAREFGVDSRVFDLVSVHCRARAADNPEAQFQTPVTEEEVARSPPISLPLRLLHCSAISDGAAAVVLERGDGAATVLGFGQGFDQLMLADREKLTTFRATRVAAQRAYESAHLTRKEITFAEVHDAFAPFLLLDVEDVGICGPGEAGRWIQDGSLAPEGRVPVNPSGGLLGRGHPVGASGLAQLVEVSQQLRGEAGRRQLPRSAKVGLAQSIGGLASHNFVTILGHRAGG